MTTYLKQKPVKSCEQFHRKTLVKQANGTTYGGDFIESSIRGSNKKILQTHVFITPLKFSEVFMLLKFSCYWVFITLLKFSEVFMLLKFSCYWAFITLLKFSEVFILRKFSCYWVFIMLLIPFYKKSHFCFTIN